MGNIAGNIDAVTTTASQNKEGVKIEYHSACCMKIENNKENNTVEDDSGLSMSENGFTKELAKKFVKAVGMAIDFGLKDTFIRPEMWRYLEEKLEEKLEENLEENSDSENTDSLKQERVQN